MVNGDTQLNGYTIKRDKAYYRRLYRELLASPATELHDPRDRNEDAGDDAGDEE